MDTRRDFLRKAILLSGTAGFSSVLPKSIQRAVAINPQPGSTYLDAEHIVILMQENRSFDHTFGTLRGVRGYNDPRAVTLPDKNLVWLQSNKKGETFSPFHFDIKNTKATWMGSTPHSRSSQVDAWNEGKYDNWIPSKRVRDKRYADIPLTMGYYTREDIPFYYAMADAFTVCDQNFCSGITCTRPNRLFFWTGTIRAEQHGNSKAFIRNEDESYGTIPSIWNTFPERLEQNGISWKFYQNDIACGGGLEGEERAWLANFGCNPLEWYANYNVKFSTRYIQSLQNQVAKLPKEIQSLQQQAAALPNNDERLKKIQTAIAKKQEALDNAKKELTAYSQEAFDKLTPEEKSLYERAFTINADDPYYHELTPLNYEDNGTPRELNIPKGDVLYQFRNDVKEGKLPTVSWLASAQLLSDHPSAPWYGSLYASEILNILTDNPEVWKKTIFIVTFDENDGYFDHIPPFVAPDPKNPQTGRCSKGIDTGVEYIYLEDELKEGLPAREARGGPIGLGFRVPMMIASPWSRGGQVCSQVFDHTSTLQFLEDFFKKKFNKDVRESNISEWRRTICGNLTSAFKPYHAEKTAQLPYLKKDAFIEKIYNAKFKKIPAGYKALSREEMDEVNKNPTASRLLPGQEKGIKPSCALPYELYVEGSVSDDKKGFGITFSAQDKIFGKQAVGSAFNAYIPGKDIPGRSYAVAAGDKISDSFSFDLFDDNYYHICVNGPNGFFREFKGKKADPPVMIAVEYEHAKSLKKKLTGNVVVICKNLHPSQHYQMEITDNAYKNKTVRKELQAVKEEQSIVLNLNKSHNWYDFSIRIKGTDNFERRYAGHVETGKDSFTDPVMGGMET
jgi:phospholipase C